MITLPEELEILVGEPEEPVFSANLAEALARLASVRHEQRETRAEAIELLARACELAPDRGGLRDRLAQWRKVSEAEEGFWEEIAGSIEKRPRRTGRLIPWPGSVRWVAAAGAVAPPEAKGPTAEAAKNPTPATPPTIDATSIDAPRLMVSLPSTPRAVPEPPRRWVRSPGP